MLYLIWEIKVDSNEKRFDWYVRRSLSSHVRMRKKVALLLVYLSPEASPLFEKIVTITTLGR